MWGTIDGKIVVYVKQRQITRGGKRISGWQASLRKPITGGPTCEIKEGAIERQLEACAFVLHVPVERIPHVVVIIEKRRSSTMENHQIEEDDLANISQPGEEEPPMKPVRDSYEIKGPWPNDPRSVAGAHYYTLYEDGQPVAEVYGLTQQEALERALLLAGAPRMADTIENILDVPRVNERTASRKKRRFYPANAIGDALVESQGVKCEQCETLGQPSRMVFSPTNRLYHPTCVPEEVKAAIAAESKAAGEDDCDF